MSADSAYQPPKSTLVDEHSSKMCRKGKYTIVNPEIEWPSRCFKCNAETDLRKKTKLAYLNPWFYLSILINILVTIILSMIFSKRFTIEMPLCEQHMSKRKNLVVLQWTLVAVMLLSIAAAAATSNELFIAPAIFTLLLVVVLAIFGRLAFAAKYKNGNLWIKGAGKKFLNSLPEFVA